MNIRQQTAQTAVPVISKAVDVLLEQVGLRRLHQDRKDEAIAACEAAKAKLDEYIALVKAQAPAVAVQPSPVVYVPVDRYVRTSRLGGSHYAINGFIGGTMDNGGPRPDNERHFPKESIVDVSKVGLLGIDRKWLLGQHNVDVLNFVKKFPRSITLL